MGGQVISPPLPWGGHREPCHVLLQVFVVKASGAVFVNQIYTQLPLSAGEGASLPRPLTPPPPDSPTP